MKRDKYDTIFSDIVRCRSNWTCECCGKYYPEGERGGLHCSHYMSRRHQATRYDPDNAFTHCFSCHQKLGGSPALFYRWFVEQKGEYTEQAITEKAQLIKKWKRSKIKSKNEKDQMRQWYQEQYNKMLEVRNLGITERIEIIGWE